MLQQNSTESIFLPLPKANHFLFFFSLVFLQAIAEYVIGKYRLHNFPPSHGDYSPHIIPVFSEPEVQLTEKKLIFIVQMMEIILSPTSVLNFSPFSL